MYLVILDDAEMNNFLVAAALREIDDIVTKSFTEPANALAFAISHASEVALFIVDYEMPGMNGIEFVGQVCLQPGLTHTPKIMITSFNQRSLRRTALEAGVTDFISKPFDHFEIRARTINLLALDRARRREQNRAAWLAREVAKAVATIEEREREIVTRLVMATEGRDKETGLHVQRVAAYVDVIARQLGLSDAECRAMALASTMHDVGKIVVPDAILLKEGPLNTQERTAINRHTEAGFAMLDGSSIETLRLAAQIALCHHERWDGEGYPRGLSGDDIPLCGRITAVADAFDALVSNRPYKAGWSLPDARAYLEKQSGHQFDPQCIKAFVAGWDRVQSITETCPRSVLSQRA